MISRSLFILGFILMCSDFSSFSQQIMGEWKISRVITDSTTQEYILTPLREDVDHYDYGNHFKLGEDNSFHSYYTAPCGNDCFTTSHGEYRFIDDDHIEFILDTVSYFKECSNKISHLEFPVTVGPYYIHNEGSTAMLIKSDGNIEQDKLNLFYSKFIDSSVAEVKKFTYLEEVVKPDSAIPFTDDRIVELYLSSVDQKEAACKIVYSKRAYRKVIILVELNNELKIISSNATGSPEEQTIYQVSTYDLSDVNKSLERARAIDLRKRRLKIETIKEEKEHYYELTKIHRIKDEIVKVVYDKISPDATIRTEYYLNEGSTFYVEQSYNLVRNGDDFLSRCEYFVTGEGQFVMREQIQSYQAVNRYSYYTCMDRLSEILRK